MEFVTSTSQIPAKEWYIYLCSRHIYTFDDAVSQLYVRRIVSQGRAQALKDALQVILARDLTFMDS